MNRPEYDAPQIQNFKSITPEQAFMMHVTGVEVYYTSVTEAPVPVPDLWLKKYGADPGKWADATLGCRLYIKEYP